MTTYSIPGKPTPLYRPRFTKAGHTYDPQKDIKLEVQELLRIQHQGKPYHQPLELNATFAFQPPKKNKRQAIQLIEQRLYPKRPDLDNLIKFILDASNTVLFNDDALIVKIIAHKIYAATPYTTFTLTPLVEDISNGKKS